MDEPTILYFRLRSVSEEIIIEVQHIREDKEVFPRGVGCVLHVMAPLLRLAGRLYARSLSLWAPNNSDGGWSDSSWVIGCGRRTINSTADFMFLNLLAWASSSVYVSGILAGWLPNGSGCISWKSFTDSWDRHLYLFWSYKPLVLIYFTICLSVIHPHWERPLCERAT